MKVFSYWTICCNDTNNIFFCFHERYWTAPSYFHSSVLVKSLYCDIFVVIKHTVLECRAYTTLDPPTNAAIGPSPAQRRAATSKHPTTWYTTSETSGGRRRSSERAGVRRSMPLRGANKSPTIIHAVSAAAVTVSVVTGHLSSSNTRHILRKLSSPISDPG